MKLKRNLFAVAAIAAALTSCSKTEIIDNNPVSKGGVEIQAKSVHQLVDGTITRVPYVGNIAVDNKLDARVITFAPTTDLSYADGTMIFATTFDPMAYNTTSATVNGSSKFPVVGGAVTGDEEYTMYGLYPATGWTASVPALTDRPEIIFTGKEDVMVAAKATTTYNNVVNGLYPTLTFKHQLTKLSVKVQAVDAVAKALWSDLSSIKLVKVAGDASVVRNKAIYQPGAGNVDFDGNAPTSFWIINSSQAYTDTEFTGQTAAINIPNATASNIVPIAYSMVAPFAVAGTPSTIGDITLEVKAKLSGAEVTKLINLNFPNMLTSTAGYAYNITLSFTDGLDIVATAEVVDWIEGGDVGGIIM